MHHLVEIPLRRETTGSDRDVIGDRLWAGGAVGVEEQEAAIIGAFADLSAALAAAESLDGHLRSVDDSTGLDAWRDYATSVDVGPFTIRAPWTEPGTGIDIVIDPGHTFGSGSHPSTRLAATLLAKHVQTGMRVVDLGAGSGVLSIIAARLGASVTAIDIDPDSESTIETNARHNGVADLVTVATNAIESTPTTADLTVLNVTIDIHERVAPTLPRETGPLIVAGILSGEQERRCATAHARTIVDRSVDGEWAALVLDHGAATTPS